jgi:hypothetical protein
VSESEPWNKSFNELADYAEPIKDLSRTELLARILHSTRIVELAAEEGHWLLGRKVDRFLEIRIENNIGVGKDEQVSFGHSQSILIIHGPISFVISQNHPQIELLCQFRIS